VSDSLAVPRTSALVQEDPSSDRRGEGLIGVDHGFKPLLVFAARSFIEFKGYVSDVMRPVVISVLAVECIAVKISTTHPPKPPTK
jgi:hypothetical protein